MQATYLRTSAFSANALQPTKAYVTSRSRSSCVVVKAVQDLKGIVVSTAMDKTVVVAVERLQPHATYAKRTRVTKRFFAHNEGTCQVGDYVRLEGCRPLSKHKRFTVAEIIRTAQ